MWLNTVTSFLKGVYGLSCCLDSLLVKLNNTLILTGLVASFPKAILGK